MRRRIVPTISLLMLMACLALWVRSCTSFESILWGYPQGQRQLSSNSGTLFYSDWENPDPSSTGLPVTYTCHPAYSAQLAYWSEQCVHFIGFTFTWRTPTNPTFQIGVPYWLICLAISFPCLIRVTRYVKAKQRKAQGVCINCGYNLTGNVSGICPECGEKI